MTRMTTWSTNVLAWFAVAEWNKREQFADAQPRVTRTKDPVNAIDGEARIGTSVFKPAIHCCSHFHINCPVKTHRQHKIIESWH